MKRVLSGLAIVCIVGVEGTALAQNAAAAEDLFQRGKTQMVEKNFADACPLLAESYRLDPAGGTLQNLGVCYEELGKTASAYARFEQLKSLSKNARPPRPDRVEIAEAHIAALLPRLSRLEVLMPFANRKAGAVLRIDGVRYDAASWDGILLDPGSHTLEVSAPQRASFRTTLEVKHDRTKLRASIPELEVVAAPGALRSPGMRTAGFAVGGVGIVALGTGAAFGVLAAVTNGAANDKCAREGNTCTVQQANDSNGRRDDARLFANVSNVLLPVGVVGLALGSVLIWQGSKKTAPALGSLQLTPSWGRLTLGGTFQ